MELQQLANELPGAELSDKYGPGKQQVSENDTILVRLVNKMIEDAHHAGASDIHVEAYEGEASTRIRFRIDGSLTDYLKLPYTLRSAIVSRIKIMASMDIAEHRKPQDGKIDFSRFAPLKLELRVASLPTANGLEDVVMRLLASSKPIPLSQLGFSPALEAQLKDMVHRTYGLILACGPTGSGKTTTLHSLLAEVNTTENKIWTAEDPIEITHPGLRQIQMIPRAGLTFATAMRAFLRADPDIIMIGEMRDAETTHMAIEASLTGHLVLSTLHTNSAPESVVRLLDMGLDPFNFSDALVGVLSQRLARKLCTHCKIPRASTADEIRDMAHEYCSHTELDPEQVLAEVSRARGPRSLSTHLKSRLGLQGLKMALVHELATPEQLQDAAALARLLKAMPITLAKARPLDEAISTAGGVRFEALDSHLMSTAQPGLFCAGEMLDWEAPTGGYLLTATMASGRQAAQGVLAWLKLRS